MAYRENYNTDLGVAFEGMMADTSPAIVISRTIEDASGVGFGLPVKQGTKENGCLKTTAGTLAVLGITIRHQALPSEAVDVYPQGYNVSLLREGVIWVKVTDVGGVVAGDPVWLDITTGQFSNADPGTAKGLRLAGSRWESAAANGALAKIRVDLNVPAVAGAA